MNSQNKTLSKHGFLNNIFDSLKKISLDIKNRTFIKSYKIFGIVFLSIYFDGLCDNYLLFDTLLVFKNENNRDFWNDWE